MSEPGRQGLAAAALSGTARRLFLAGALAFLAGATDVYGLAQLRDIFVSFMSGNTTMLGIALGRQDWMHAGLIGAIIGLFVAGAAAGAALQIAAGRRHLSAVVAAVAAALAVPLIRPDWAAFVYVFAMGALNAATNRVGEATVGLTYVTGTLVKFGQGLGQTLCGRGTGRSWLLQAPMWMSLLAGAITAAALTARFGAHSFWLLACLGVVTATGAIALDVTGRRG